ncbi:hypothetical protein RI367_004086 [Sorochytrium milnesiophthora]
MDTNVFAPLVMLGSLFKERFIQEASRVLGAAVLRGNDGNALVDQHARKLYQLKISNADQYSAHLRGSRDLAEHLMADFAAGFDNMGGIAVVDVDGKGLAMRDLVEL